MNFENDKEVAKILRSVRAGKVPASLLKNFEDQTWGKIHASTARAALISTAGMLSMTAAALALALWIYLLPVPQTTVPQNKHVVMPQTPAGMDEPAAFNQLHHDLLLLELLGEDSGLLEDPDSDIGLIENSLTLPGL